MYIGLQVYIYASRVYDRIRAHTHTNRGDVGKGIIHKARADDAKLSKPIFILRRLQGRTQREVQLVRKLPPLALLNFKKFRIFLQKCVKLADFT